MSPNDASKRTSVLIASFLVVAPLAASCARVGAQTVDTAARFIVMGVAGNCPTGTGWMRPTLAGTMPDFNGDGYVCPMQVRSITGDTLRLAVDNDVATPEGVWIQPEPYIGM